MSSTSIGRLTSAGAAVAGYPLDASACVTCALNAAVCAANCERDNPLPSTAEITCSPMWMEATVPGGCETVLYGTALRASAALAESRERVNDAVPTGLNCSEHSPGGAYTVTGAMV